MLSAASPPTLANNARMGHPRSVMEKEKQAVDKGGPPANNPLGLGNGLHENLELGRIGDASRTMYLNDTQQAKLYALIKQYRDMGQDGWKLGTPCSTFAANAWKSATGEKLNVHWGPISNPTTLKESIIAANGGVSHQTVQQAGPNASSSADGSSGSSGSSLNWLGWLLP